MSETTSTSQRASRRHPVVRRDKIVTCRCQDVEEAKALQMFLQDFFRAAGTIDRAFEAVVTENPKAFHPHAMMAEIVPVDEPAEGHT